jgi:probable addiction module antidote protein
MPEHVPPQLDTLDAVAIHLASAFESGDPYLIAVALSAVAAAPGGAELAAAAGIPRQQLADALNAGEMPLEMTLAIMKVIDLHLPGTRSH